MRALIIALSLLALVALGCGGSAPPAQTHLEAVSVAPEFSAPDETGKLRSLSEFRGKTLVLYFYPKDGTPGCTRQACAFRDAWDKLQKTGAVVVGISLDSVESHAAFKREHKLPFPLLSDLDGRILEAYGVPRSPQGYAARTTFVIDAQGVIRRIFPEVDPAVHIEEVLPVLERLRREPATPKEAEPEPAPTGAAAAPTPPPAPAPTTSSTNPTWIIFLEPARAEALSSPTEAEQRAVERHFDYLKLLRDSGVVLLAGPSLEAPYTGIVIFRASDRRSAERVLGSDPAVSAGVFKARLSEFRMSLSASN